MYRTFQSGDEKEMIRLWNSALNHDPINPRRFRNQVLLDINFNPEGLIVAEQEGKLIGAVLSIVRVSPMEGAELERETGWITFFIVQPEARGKGIGANLLERATRFLQKQGVEKVFFSSYAPNYFLPGIDETAYPAGYRLLLQKGFQRVYSPVAMHRTLTDYVYPEQVRLLKWQREQEGYSFDSVQDGDFYELIQFANSQFNPDWGRAIRDGVLQGMAPSQILVAKKHDQIVGFAMHGGYEGIRERFGPFGVDGREQGKGLGKILLHETLLSMKQQMVLGAWFLWTSETSAAGFLYLKNGFQTYRTFHVMVKELTNGTLHQMIRTD